MRNQSSPTPVTIEVEKKKMIFSQKKKQKKKKKKEGKHTVPHQ
jgi:hypothetical protein